MPLRIVDWRGRGVIVVRAAAIFKIADASGRVIAKVVSIARQQAAPIIIGESIGCVGDIGTIGDGFVIVLDIVKAVVIVTQAQTIIRGGVVCVGVDSHANLFQMSTQRRLGGS